MRNSTIHKSLTLVVTFIASVTAKELPTALTDAEADAIVAQQVASKAQQVSEHLANTESFTILERREIDFGGRKLISHRVADPGLPKTKNKAPLATLPTTSLPPRSFMYTSKENHTVLLSATVHEGEPTVTHLRWRILGLAEQELEAWSNIDWRLMSGTSNLESETDSYFILLGVGLPSYSDEVPSLPISVDGKAEYFVYADSNDGVEEKAFEVIDLLHSYYEVNEPQLKIHHQRREAINDAWERHKAANPAKPQKAEIYFWKPDAN